MFARKKCMRKGYIYWNKHIKIKLTEECMRDTMLGHRMCQGLHIKNVLFFSYGYLEHYIVQMYEKWSRPFKNIKLSFIIRLQFSNGSL